MLILGCPEYRSYESKRLCNVMKTVMVPSIAECSQLCYETDGCLAINVMQNSDVICELTTGMSNEDEMEENAAYLLLVRGIF